MATPVAVAWFAGHTLTNNSNCYTKVPNLFYLIFGTIQYNTRIKFTNVAKGSELETPAADGKQQQRVGHI